MIAAWRRFWFEADGRAQFRIFRLVFGVLLFAAYLARSLDLQFYFGDQGIASRAAIDEMFAGRPLFYFHWLFASPVRIWLANAVFLGALLWVAFGRRFRIAAALAAFLHLSFFHRNPTIVYGVDFVASFYLFFLCLADDRGFAEALPRPDSRSRLGSVALRLGQLQLCIIYGFSGIKKLKGMHWWSGEALWDALASPIYARWDFSWLARFPHLVLALTYAVLIWEIYFPALIWNRKLRAPLLFFGLALHLAIAVALNIPFFSAAMASTYILFVDPYTARRVLGWDKMPQRRELRLGRFGSTQI